MPDMTLIAGTVASLKAASDLAKGLVGIRDATMINDKVIELQRVILAAQSDAFAAQTEIYEMHERVREMEGRIARIEKWEEERQRYELKQLPPGAYVYALKQSCSNGEPPHHICPTCFGNGRKEILQSRGKTNGIEMLHCNACGADIQHGTFIPPQVTVDLF